MSKESLIWGERRDVLGGLKGCKEIEAFPTIFFLKVGS